MIGLIAFASVLGQLRTRRGAKAQIDKHIGDLETLIAAERKISRIMLDLKDMTLTGQDGISFSLSAKRLTLRW